MNPYVLKIHKKITTKHLSLLRIKNEEVGKRLEDIYRLHIEGKSTREITDFMNQKYGTTLRTNRPYYPELVWGSLDKYKKRLKRLDSIEESYVSVEFEKVEISKTKSDLLLTLLIK